MKAIIGEQRRQAKRRVAMKRLLRKHGITVSEHIRYSESGLRKRIRDWVIAPSVQPPADMDSPSLYEALDSSGRPYWRPARTIGELPTCKERLKSCMTATLNIEQLTGLRATHHIKFGPAVYTSFGLTLGEAKRHPYAAILLTRGDCLSLAFCDAGEKTAHLAVTIEGSHQ